MESEVRRDGCLGGQAAEEAGGREHAAEAVAGRRYARQCGVEGPFGKEMVTPAVERKAVAHLRAAFEMSERRACKLNARYGQDRRSNQPGRRIV
jgi:putative transposase